MENSQKKREFKKFSRWWRKKVNKCTSKATIQAMEFGLFKNYKVRSRCVSWRKQTV